MEEGYVQGGYAASKPLRANDNFERTVPTCEPHPIHLALAGGIVRSGEFVGLGSMMVKRARRGRETTSAAGAEIR